MIIRLRQIVLLQFSICIAPINMDPRVRRHKCDSFIQYGHSLMIPPLLEQTCPHIVIRQAYLYCHVLLEPFGEHELAGSLQIC